MKAFILASSTTRSIEAEAFPGTRPVLIAIIRMTATASARRSVPIATATSARGEHAETGPTESVRVETVSAAVCLVDKRTVMIPVSERAQPLPRLPLALPTTF